MRKWIEKRRRKAYKKWLRKSRENEICGAIDRDIENSQMTTRDITFNVYEREKGTMIFNGETIKAGVTKIEYQSTPYGTARVFTMLEIL